MLITSVSIKEIAKTIPNAMFNIAEGYSGYPRTARYVESDRSITVFVDVESDEKIYMCRGHVSRFVSLLK